MWRTSFGDGEEKNRVLKGAERDIFIHAVACWFVEVTGGHTQLHAIMELLDKGEADHVANHDFPPPFADMPMTQQMVSVAFVTKALLQENFDFGDHTAWNEATVAAIYESLSVEIVMEMDYAKDDPTVLHHQFHRSVVFDKYREMFLAEGEDGEIMLEDIPDDMLAVDDWDELIEVLKDRILWDDDYDMLAIADDAVIAASVLKEAVGIQPDYFSDAPPIDTRRAVIASVRYLYHLSDAFHQDYHERVTLKEKKDGLATDSE